MKKKLLELNKELISLIEQFSDKGLPIEKYTKRNLLLMFAFTKSYKTTNSILILCEKGNGQDAFMLVRTLFELLITIRYIFEKDTKSRIAQYYNYDDVLRSRIFSTIKKGKSHDVKQELRELVNKGEINLKSVKEKSKQILQNYTSDDAETWSKRSIFRMAKEVGLKELYNSLYALGSQFIHSASRSENAYMKIVNDKVDLLTYPSDEYVVESLVDSFTCFHQMVKQLNDIFNLKLEKRLSEIEDEMKETLVQSN